MSNFQAISWREQVAFWFFIMLTHWNNNPRVEMSLRIIMISSQRVFAVCLADKRSSKYQFNSLWFEPDRCSSPRSITLETSTLIITPPMQSWYWIYGANEDISNASLICVQFQIKNHNTKCIYFSVDIVHDEYKMKEKLQNTSTRNTR